MAKNLTNNKISPKKRATSYDVAELAGVSQSAVSRCFKTGASVSKKTRDKVMQAANELGYQPNAIARGLITRRSNIVAVITTAATTLSYPEVLSKLNAEFEKHGVHILLFTLHSESDVDEVLNQVWQYQVDGIIAAAQFTDSQIDACMNRQIPLIFFNRVYPDISVSSVCCDHAEGERILVKGLVDKGHKNFIVMAGPQDSAVSTARTDGAVSQLNAAGVSHQLLQGDYSYQTAFDLVDDYAKSGDLPDAIICANDVMAMGTIDALRHHHQVNIPEQVEVVGFDGVGPASWQSYDLTTIKQPLERMVEAAVTMLLERVEDPELPAEKRLFAGNLARGTSAVI